MKLKEEGQVGTTIVMLGEWRCQKGDYGGKNRVRVSLHRARNYHAQGTANFLRPSIFLPKPLPSLNLSVWGQTRAIPVGTKKYCADLGLRGHGGTSGNSRWGLTAWDEVLVITGPAILYHR